MKLWYLFVLKLRKTQPFFPLTKNWESLKKKNKSSLTSPLTTNKTPVDCPNQTKATNWPNSINSSHLIPISSHGIIIHLEIIANVLRVISQAKRTRIYLVTWQGGRLGLGDGHVSHTGFTWEWYIYFKRNTMKYIYIHLQIYQFTITISMYLHLP